ncbi:hypothetical protein IHE44_0010986 [Lamprotornis superbus]|uniref:AP-1 complex subunit mu-2 n=1 Tax=Lamprotornis superbus TaxID=245042 RepID=A0A835NDP7_9PASS|nr:hypothetical protein IHE44_0010986 [Lamprotornis superbus]
MAASALFILDLKGKPLISRNYKGDVGLGEIENFMGVLLQREEEGTLTPVLTYGHVHFLWIKHANLYLVATTKKNGNASLVFSFLYKVVEVSWGVWGGLGVTLIRGGGVTEVFSEYFKELEEESIRDNFVIIYELLDELMDFGFPQTTDSKILQEYITQEGNKLDTGRSRVPTTVTNAVSWRSEGIRYKKNEVFIDVIESVNLLVSANGSVVLSEVVGTIKLKVFLSGMPELRLGLNDRVLFELTGRGKNKSVELEDVKFHQCVRLSRFDNDRTISFIPPDGDFELMSYRLHTQVKPLIWIESIIEKFSHSRVEIMVKAKGQFKKQSVANGVEIAIPVPSDADSPKFKTTVGSARYLPERNVVIWSIKSFPVSIPCAPQPREHPLSPPKPPRGVPPVPPQPGGGRGGPHEPLRGSQGGKEHLMRAHFGLPSVEKEEEEGRPPIAVRFEIPYFTVSGIQVRYMKIIEKSGYQALPWVRYITQSGDYQIRTS